MTNQLPTRMPRADVVRNRAKILDAAQRHFLAHGVATSLDAVARDAGVGPATLYRHFPSREALLADLLELRRAELIERQRRIDTLADAGDALREWLRALEDYFSLYNGLPEPLLAATREQAGDNPLTQSCEDLITITGKYLKAAQRDGHARGGVQDLDLFLAANSVAWIRGTGAADEASLARLRTILETGYRDEQMMGSA